MKPSMETKTSVLVIDQRTSNILVNEIDAATVQAIKNHLSNDGTTKIKQNGREVRISRVSDSNAIAYGISHDSDHVNSPKKFSSYLKFFLLSYENFNKHLQRIEDREAAKFRRLIHNLRSLNAKIIQEIYFIALQDRLIGNASRTIDYISSEIEKDTKSAARALLSILKCSSAQRAEFSAFEKINGKVVILDKAPHSIHQVVMNVFYLFFSEYTDKKVRCDVNKTDLHGFFDYESIQVCLYHIVENSAKYTKNGSNLDVYFKKNGNFIEIIFEMISLAVDNDEVDNIFKEGISGRMACNKNLQGSGFGLTISHEMARINGGSLKLIAGTREKGNGEYARNKFIITVPAFDSRTQDNHRH